MKELKTVSYEAFRSKSASTTAADWLTTVIDVVIDLIK